MIPKGRHFKGKLKLTVSINCMLPVPVRIHILKQGIDRIHRVPNVEVLLVVLKIESLIVVGMGLVPAEYAHILASH